MVLWLSVVNRGSIVRAYQLKNASIKGGVRGGVNCFINNLGVCDFKPTSPKVFVDAMYRRTLLKYKVLHRSKTGGGKIQTGVLTQNR